MAEEKRALEADLDPEKRGDAPADAPPTTTDAPGGHDDEIASTPFDSPYFIPSLLWLGVAWFGWDSWVRPMEEWLAFNRFGFGFLLGAAIHASVDAVRPHRFLLAGLFFAYSAWLGTLAYLPDTSFSSAFVVHDESRLFATYSFEVAVGGFLFAVIRGLRPGRFLLPGLFWGYAAWFLLRLRLEAPADGLLGLGQQLMWVVPAATAIVLSLQALRAPRGPAAAARP